MAYCPFIRSDFSFSPVRYQFSNGFKGYCMDENEMRNFVKAVADADRLQIVGLLAQKSASLSEINATLGFHPSDTRRHLDQLLQSGVIRISEGAYELDSNALEKLALQQFEGARAAFTPEAGLEKNQRQVLSAHLNTDGTIKQIPPQPAKRQVILDYLINAFSFEANYKEKEVNMILAHFHPDTATLRRALVDAEMLARERDGSRYWRPK